jgi:putative membrane protein
MMWGPYMWQGWGWMSWWMLVPALFGVALLGILFWAIARLSRPGSARDYLRPSADVAPEEILRRRYASGEIDAQTYDAMRERLAGDQSRETATPGV